MRAFYDMAATNRLIDGLKSRLSDAEAERDEAVRLLRLEHGHLAAGPTRSCTTCEFLARIDGGENPNGE